MEQKFTKRDLEVAVDQLALLPYFPADGRAAVMIQLAAMMPHKRALDWVVQQVTSRCNQWPGPAELRGLLCTRFDAADGLDNPSCSIPGHTIEEREARYLEASRQELGLDKELSAETRRLIAGAAKKLSEGIQ